MNASNSNPDPRDQVIRLPAGPARLMRKVAQTFTPPEGGFDAGDFFAPWRQCSFAFLGLCRKYRWLILGIFCAALAIGYLVTRLSTPVYRASAVIEIQPPTIRIVTKRRMFRPRVAVVDRIRFYNTQFDLLRSRSLAERVVAELNLGAERDFFDPPRFSLWDRLYDMLKARKPVEKDDLQRNMDAAVRMVQAGLTTSAVQLNLSSHRERVAQVMVPNRVRITFDSLSRRWAQRIADGVAKSFIGANIDRNHGATNYARQFLKERLDEFKLRLGESEKLLISYAARNGIVRPADASESLAESDLMALNAALQRASIDRIAAQRLWEQANGTASWGLPQFLNDPGFQALRLLGSAKRVEYQAKLSSFKAAYSDMVRLKAQISQVDREIRTAADVIRQSLKARYQSAVAQEEMLKQKVAEAKVGVLNARSKQIQYEILQREVDADRALYGGLLRQYKVVGAVGAGDRSNIVIIEPAGLPGAPFKPNLRKNLLGSSLLGLLAVGLAILVLEILNDSFKAPDEIEEQLGLPVLGIIPLAEDDELADMTAVSPTAPITEAFRSFRTALQFSTDSGVPKCLLVTGARPGEGKSTTALALAVTFAQLGGKVLLIDADLRKPSQHVRLKLDNSVGLANCLIGSASFAGLVRETAVGGLYFLAAGPLPPNPAKLLGGDRMTALLASAAEQFDTVIIDSPPVMELADATVLSNIAAGTVLVIRSGDTRRAAVRAALKRLRHARARVVGTVMNRFDLRAAQYGYGYGALEYYSYGRRPTTFGWGIRRWAHR